MKTARLEIANNFIKIISKHGRKFFSYEDRLGFFSIERGHVYWNCEWSQKKIYLSYKYWRFHHGGTLRRLINSLAQYIRGKGELPTRQLGPWEKWVCGDGDMWGYGLDEMEKVRKEINLITKKPSKR